MKTKSQAIVTRAARLSALASLAAGSLEDLDDVDGWEASDGEHDALDADMRQALDRRADPEEHKAFAKAYRTEVAACWAAAESGADKHLAAISWTTSEGTSTEALGLGGDEAWGAGETGWDEVDQGAWSDLCRMAVRREAHRRIAASRQ